MSFRTETRRAFAAPGDPDFRIDDYPLYNLNHTSWTYIEEMSKLLKALDMDQPRWRVLTLLGDRNPSTVTELASRSVTKLSTITRILDRMQEEGLVERAPAPHDNRVTQVWITERGREALARVSVVAARVFHKAFVNISDEEITQFMDILRRIRENLLRSPYMD